MTSVKRPPFNSIPKDWAFDSAKGPFIRDILEILLQMRERTGGDENVNLAEYLPLNGALPMSGDLDMGGNDVENVNLVDGRDVSADGTKLNTIETGATNDNTLAWLL